MSYCVFGVERVNNEIRIRQMQTLYYPTEFRYFPKFRVENICNKERFLEVKLTFSQPSQRELISGFISPHRRQ